MILQAKNNPYFIAVGGIFILLKIRFKLASFEDLLFLLKPVDTIVGLMLNSQARYLPDVGYYHVGWNIAIDKSCSGFNFLLLAFVLFALILLPYFEKKIHKIGAVLGAFLGAYLLTIFANSSRIYTAIVVQNQTIDSFPENQHTIHEAVGIITNVSFLVLAYFILNQRLTKIKNNETPA